ncbi:MAG: hypothetical protein O3B31_14770 [Chloroflexi bacterium]|nr:hypothetical protein [Chloroflexota bacterium]
MFSTWTDRRYFDVDRVVDTLGNVPGELIFVSFDMLKPAGRVAGQLRLLERARDDKFVRAFMLVDRWAADQIPFPGECFRQVTKELFWENKLLRGELELGGHRIDLSSITQPMIHITAEHDHTSPRPLPLISRARSAVRTTATSCSRADTPVWSPEETPSSVCGRSSRIGSQYGQSDHERSAGV